MNRNDALRKLQSAGPCRACAERWIEADTGKLFCGCDAEIKIEREGETMFYPNGDAQEPPARPARIGERPRWTPNELFRLAATNSLAATFINVWRAGNLSFEEMLIGLALELAAQREQFLRAAVREDIARVATEPIRAGRATVPPNFENMTMAELKIHEDGSATVAIGPRPQTVRPCACGECEQPKRATPPPPAIRKSREWLFTDHTEADIEAMRQAGAREARKIEKLWLDVLLAPVEEILNEKRQPTETDLGKIAEAMSLDARYRANRNDTLPAVVEELMAAARTELDLPPDYETLVDPDADDDDGDLDEAAASDRAIEFGRPQAAALSTSDCPDCHGIGRYQPLVGPAEQCRTCCSPLSLNATPAEIEAASAKLRA